MAVRQNDSAVPDVEHVEAFHGSAAAMLRYCGDDSICVIIEDWFTNMAHSIAHILATLLFMLMFHVAFACSALSLEHTFLFTNISIISVPLSRVCS